MGQYHIPVNIDKREFVHPHSMGDGLKAIEQAYGGLGSTQAAVQLLLTCSDNRGGGDFCDETGAAGHWAGDRIIWIGDYTEADDVPSVPYVDMIYGLCVAADLRDETYAHWLERIQDTEHPDMVAQAARWFAAYAEYGWFRNIAGWTRKYFENIRWEEERVIYKGDKGWRQRLQPGVSA